MKLLPGLQSIEQGQAQPVPFSFKPFLLPWMKAEYKRYDFGFALMQEFINKKFSVFSWRLHIETATRMYPVTDRPVIAIQFTLEGTMPVRNNGQPEKQSGSVGFELQYIPKRVHEVWFEPGRYEFLYIEINPGYLEDLADTDTGIGELLKSMKHSSATPVSHVSVPINYITRAILNNLHTCHDKGGNLRLELQKYILELLSEYLHEIEEVDKDRCLGPVPHKKQMMAIKAGVMQCPNISEQSLERLSRRYGISMTAMKLDFKALFGFTLAAYVRFHALTKAHYLIVSTNRPIDDIASEVGYIYRTNFNQAFKKQFHYLPGQLREKKETPVQIPQL